MMADLTRKQEKVLEFIRRFRELNGHSPSMREIAAHYGVNVTAAADHVRALRKKGFLAHEARRARSLRVVSPYDGLRKRILDIPLYGSIPAGFPHDGTPDPHSCISIDVGSLGIKPKDNLFALEVRGNSMIGRNILPGDIVIFEHGASPQNGDVVAALIAGENTLKTFVNEKGKSYLRAENPAFPKLFPAAELVIQGVMVALIRRGSGSAS